MLLLATIMGSLAALALLVLLCGVTYLSLAFLAELLWALLLRPKLVTSAIAASFACTFAVVEALTNIPIALAVASLATPLFAWPLANLLVWLTGRSIGMNPSLGGLLSRRWSNAFTEAARERARKAYVAPTVQLDEPG